MEEEDNLSRISDSDGDANDLPDGASLPWQNRARSLNRDDVLNTYSSLRSCTPPSKDSFVTRSFRSRRDANYRSPAEEFDRLSQRTRTRSVGLLETDLDTGASKEFLEVRETNLDKVYQDIQTFLGTISNSGSSSKESGSTPSSRDSGIYPKERTRAKSLLQLDASPLEQSKVMESCLTGSSRVEDNRAKSMEFLLDDDNRAAVQAPENELMKEGTERKVSEAELRVRRSLQRLDVPEWMKNSVTPQQGFILKRREPSSSSYSSSATPAGGWSGFSSKNGSMTSLSSSRANTPTKVVIPTRISTRSYGYGIGGGITSPSSNASISPTASDRVGGGSLFQYPLSRWSTSRINHSGTATPTGSLHSQRTTSSSMQRQPYLGWRSNTSLATLGSSQSSLLSGSNYVPGNNYLSPAERLALTMLPRRKDSSSSIVSKESSIAVVKEEECRSSSVAISARKLPPPKGKLDDVQSSIKEVTSAIVHYCTETSSPHQSPKLSPRLSYPHGSSSNPPRAPSPKRKVWVESSFVGSRPIGSPETPLPPTTVNGHSEKVSKSSIKAPPEPPRRGAPQPPSKYVVAR